MVIQTSLMSPVCVGGSETDPMPFKKVYKSAN